MSDEEHMNTASDNGGESGGAATGETSGAKRGRGRPKKGSGVASSSKAIKKPPTAGTRASARNTKAEKPKSPPKPVHSEESGEDEEPAPAPTATKGRGRPAGPPKPAATTAAPSAPKGRGRPKKN